MGEFAEQHEFIAGLSLLRVSRRQDGDRLDLIFRIDTEEPCRLHWGLERSGGAWQKPPEAWWPRQTEAFNNNAVQSPFVLGGQGEQTVQIQLELTQGWRSLPFVLYFPTTRRWIKDGRQDFRLPLHSPSGPPSAEMLLAAATHDGDWRRQGYDLGNGQYLWAAVLETPASLRVMFSCDAEAPLLLHWGLADRFPQEWRLPPPEARPIGSAVFDSKAVQTVFGERDGVRWLELTLRKPKAGDGLRGLDFVLYQPAFGYWLKAGNQDMYLPLLKPSYEAVPFEAPEQQRLADAIIGAELDKSSWTLMHRFNLAHDLLDGVGEDEEAHALVFAWLRYSAIRQLDWQRRYNTKPRELAHAQNRLTYRLADRYRSHPKSRPWLRLLLGTLGRGGSRGQQVRDEILNIMHRHKVKQAGERFMEEWHQKLHNNTTPDDIVICEAYLAFLESDGDLDRFYSVLAEGGVSRERLQSFDRPIKTDPLFFPEKKAGLNHDFRNYLRVLKSVHASTDLETAATAARGVLDESLSTKLDALFVDVSRQLPDWVRPKERYKVGSAGQREQATAEPTPRKSPVRLTPLKRAQTIVEIRSELAGRFEQRIGVEATRELIYLDLALEEALRMTIEGQELGRLAEESLFALTGLALKSLCLVVPNEELQLCAEQFAALMAASSTGTDWALRMKAVTDRTARVLGDWTETLYATLQPKAEFLGSRLGVAEWTIPLFAEEVIRGGAAFTLSLLLRRVDRLLRTRAGISGWQVISAAPAVGRLQRVASLMAVQGQRFLEATVLITPQVSGEEEIPEGVTAVLTSDTPDLVSHVAVRARNARVLFATCFDEQAFEDLNAHEGQRLTLRVSSAGEVAYETSMGPGLAETVVPRQSTPRIRRRTFSHWTVASEAFQEGIVGAKSNNLNALRGKLPEWVHFPVSMALPFGVFEAVLEAGENRKTRQTLESLLAGMGDDSSAQLARVRQTVEALAAPVPLRSALERTWSQVGLAPVAWESTWRAVTRVWASKWTERAYHSRVARDIAHDDLTMAVLIQQVVEADYAFVIHTVNPITSNRHELYVEIVLGLGETLVGNYPGRALSLVCCKDSLKASVQSYPSKSVGLYGRGVIFRSDSNGEDLADFAGAGLYDSFLAEAPHKRLLDYTAEPLLHDPKFSADLFSKIAQIGVATEQALGSPQDIEGAVQKGECYVVQTRPQVGL